MYLQIVIILYQKYIRDVLSLALRAINTGVCYSARSSTGLSADRVMSHGWHVTRHSRYHCSSILYSLIDIK